GALTNFSDVWAVNPILSLLAHVAFDEASEQRLTGLRVRHVCEHGVDVETFVAEQRSALADIRAHHVAIAFGMKLHAPDTLGEAHDRVRVARCFCQHRRAWRELDDGVLVGGVNTEWRELGLEQRIGRARNGAHGADLATARILSDTAAER